MPDAIGSAASADTAALPVAVLAEGRHAEAVRSWVEGVLGWQPVEVGADPLVPAMLELCDLDSERSPSGGVPRVLLVDDDAPAERIGRSAARMAPDAVLGWPSGRERLREVATEVLTRTVPTGNGVRLLRVGGSAGGVGTTTVALGLAGLSAWAGLRTLAAIRGSGLRLRTLPSAALAAPDLWSRADAIVGLTSLRGVVISDGGDAADLSDGNIEAAVIDAGVDADVDLLVCRPDAAALAALEVTTAAAVVLVGDGPARPRDLARAARGRRGVRLPWSARVARAGLHGRVPAGLPGAWLARLEPFALRASRASARGAVPPADRRSSLSTTRRVTRRRRRRSA